MWAHNAKSYVGHRLWVRLDPTLASAITSVAVRLRPYRTLIDFERVTPPTFTWSTYRPFFGNLTFRVLVPVVLVRVVLAEMPLPLRVKVHRAVTVKGRPVARYVLREPTLALAGPVRLPVVDGDVTVYGQATVVLFPALSRPVRVAVKSPGTDVETWIETGLAEGPEPLSVTSMDSVPTWPCSTVNGRQIPTGGEVSGKAVTV